MFFKNLKYSNKNMTSSKQSGDILLLLSSRTLPASEKLHSLGTLVAVVLKIILAILYKAGNFFLLLRQKPKTLLSDVLNL